MWGRNIIEGLLLILFKNHYPKWLVLEVGADHPGDIAAITRWLKPDVAVYTRMGDVPVHVEFFGSPEAVLAEKAHLAEALKKNGHLIVNGDEPQFASLEEKTSARIFTYARNAKAALQGMHQQVFYDKDGRPAGITFKAGYEGASIPVTLNGTVGTQYMYAALAALSTGVVLGGNMVTLADALGGYQIPAGRLSIIEGLKKTTIFDDSYNASPVAVEAALAALSGVASGGRKIAVLGDMLELGKYAIDEHKRIGKIAGEACDLVLAVGPRAQFFAEGALSGGMSEKNILQFADAQKAGKHLEGILAEGDVVLVKGSQSMRMERAVKEIMAHPEQSGDLLVRQEEEWERR